MSVPAQLVDLEFWIRRRLGQDRPVAFSHSYWQARYRWGGNSGKGSRGEIAGYKAAVITRFCRLHGLERVVELGSGDGVCAAQVRVAHYLGLEISPIANRRARRRSPPASHRFCTLRSRDPDLVRREVLAANDGILPPLSVSMDVILHLVEDEVFDTYLRTLHAISGRYIMIYSSDQEGEVQGHVRHRAYSRRFLADFPLRPVMEQHGPGAQAPYDAHFKVFEKL